MSKKLAELFGTMAEGLEAAAAAARELEGGYANAAAKSGGDAGDGVAGKPAGSKGKVADAAPAVASKPAKGGKAKAPAVTFEEVKTTLTELMNKQSKEAVKTLLSEFGAAKLTDLDEEHYADIVTKARDLMEEGAEEEGGDDDDMFGE